MPVVQSSNKDGITFKTVNLIIPPPELKNIVDKTANFVARNGKIFEERIVQKEASNKKFGFLKETDPYHKYYLKKLDDYQQGKEEVPKPIQKQQEILNKPKCDNFVPGEPPKGYEFILDPPPFSALDLDTVKLTAQFVARNGKKFLNDLMNREQKNKEFDFLRPQHALFPFFAKLIEQYTKVLIPTKDIVRLLKNDLNEKNLLDKVRYEANWLKHEQEKKDRENKKIEMERMAYSRIDWHDFYVVEVIDYQVGELGMFPTPTTPEEAGNRLISELRELKDDTIDDIEMQIVTENEEHHVQEPELNFPEPHAINSFPDPLEFTNENITVKQYDPKVSQKVDKVASTADQYVISPLTGEKIPVSNIDQHMRISLLDARWLEQRNLQNAKAMEESALASGLTVSENLKQLAERRTDIFGTGDQETAIGKKIGEEERKDTRIIWDGHTSSLESTNRAIQKATTKQPVFKTPFPVAPIRTRAERPCPLLITPPIIIMPQIQPCPAVYPAFPLPLMPPPPSLPLPVMQPQQMEINEELPVSKKPCPESKLITEEEFIASQNSPVNIHVKVPIVADKCEWNLKGQDLPLKVGLTDTILTVKQIIQEKTGMPPSKQKISFNGTFLKDCNTTAFYNLLSESTLVLQIKERGGRKK